MTMERGPLPQEERGEKNEKLERRHLKEGFAPIMACVGKLEDFFPHQRGDARKFMDSIRTSDLPNAHNVNYYGNPTELTADKFKHGRQDKDRYNSYVISPVDSRDKFSKQFYDCTGIVVAGQDQETGQNISLLTHEDPENFSNPGRQDLFSAALRERLQELKERCVEGSIDAVIVGGAYTEEDDYDEDYIASIKGSAAVVSEVLGFEPMVITGPKIVKDPETGTASDNLFYDNDNRRLYMSRPEAGIPPTKGFAPGEIEEEKKKW